MKLSRVAIWSGTWFALACGPAIQGRSPEPGSTAAILLDDATLAQLSGRTVLEAIRLRIPQVRAVWAPGGCPEILLRGTDRLMGESNPDVYVDHVHALDTCPLTALSAFDVQRVEIYPLGVTSRPGYATGAHGLILVFTRGSRAQ